MPQLKLNRKDFRIIFGNEEVNRNPDYVDITQAQADAITSGKKTAMFILKEMLYTERERDINQAASDIGIPTQASREASDGAPDIARMKLRQLQELAASRGIVIPEKTTKLELVDLLLAADAGGADGVGESMTANPEE